MTITSARIAAEIADQHDRRSRFEPLANPYRNDLDLAYAVQDDLLSFWRSALGEIAGWKVGLTTLRMQKMCGVTQPIAGAILAQRVHASPATVSAGAFVRLGVETELSFRVGKSPDPGLELTTDNVRQFLDAACASFELIEDRAADYARLDAASMIADNSWNGGVVLSTPLPIASFASFRGVRGVLEVNGQQVDSGTTDDVGGDPLGIVAWLGNALAGRGRSLEAGQWIMTGSVVPTRFAATGDTYCFTLDGFDPARLTVT
jgi:2-keto-4-pentenoate hydratase